MRTGRQMLAALLALWLLSAIAVDSVESAAEGSGAQDEWVAKFMVAVTRAAGRGPQWHRHRERIRRDLEDIEYDLTELRTASKTGDRARAEEARRQVLKILLRGKEKGYYFPEDVEPLIQLLHRD
jgi:hypothetical protein